MTHVSCHRLNPPRNDETSTLSPTKSTARTWWRRISAEEKHDSWSKPREWPSQHAVTETRQRPLVNHGSLAYTTRSRTAHRSGLDQQVNREWNNSLVQARTSSRTTGANMETSVGSKPRWGSWSRNFGRKPEAFQVRQTEIWLRSKILGIRNALCHKEAMPLCLGRYFGVRRGCCLGSRRTWCFREPVRLEPILEVAIHPV